MTAATATPHPNKTPQHGQRFTPHRAFRCACIPEQIQASTLLTAGAKLAYAELTRFAGHKDHCWPAVATIASRLGKSPRQILRYLRELRTLQLIARDRRGLGLTNVYAFLWHADVFDNGNKLLILKEVTSVSLPEVTSVSLPEVPEVSLASISPEESQTKRVIRTNEPAVRSFVDSPTDAPLCSPPPRKPPLSAQEPASDSQELAIAVGQTNAPQHALPPSIRHVPAALLAIASGYSQLADCHPHQAHAAAMELATLPDAPEAAANLLEVASQPGALASLRHAGGLTWTVRAFGQKWQAGVGARAKIAADAVRADEWRRENRAADMAHYRARLSDPTTRADQLALMTADATTLRYSPAELWPELVDLFPSQNQEH